jgi:hypothetical protein
MPDKNNTEQRWIKAASSLLNGKTVDHVRYLTEAERDALGWSGRPVVLVFRDGSYVFPSRDDEGNDAGALFTGSDALPVIPVI